MDGTLAGAEPGQAMRHRIGGQHGGLPGRFGQRQPRREPGRERRRVGAAGAVRRGHAVTGHRKGHVPRSVEEMVHRLSSVTPGHKGRPRPHRDEALG